MMRGRLPFQCGGNFPREVSLPLVTGKDALAAYASAIHAFTTARTEYGELIEMFDIDLPEQAGTPYHSTKFLLIVYMRDNAGVTYSTAIPAPIPDILETRRQRWALKDEPGQLITQAYAQLTGLSELRFEQGALVG